MAYAHAWTTSDMLYMIRLRLSLRFAALAILLKTLSLLGPEHHYKSTMSIDNRFCHNLERETKSNVIRGNSCFFLLRSARLRLLKSMGRSLQIPKRKRSWRQQRLGVFVYLQFV